MKRVISIMLCFVMLICLTACTNNGSSNNTTTAVTQSATTDTTAGADHAPSMDFTAPLTAISVPIISETTKADDGTPLFTYTYQNLFLTFADQDVAAQITLDFHNRFDYESSYAPSVLAAAKKNQPGESNWEPYSYSVIANPTRLDQSILSFHGTKSFFDGAPQSTVTAFTVNYDLLTGKVLELKEVLVPAFSAEDLSTLIKNGLKQYADSGILFADYEYIISDMFTTNTPVENWYFDNDGLCFSFSPMDIAPNNAGTLVSKVPYSALTNILKDAYFPAEQIELVGEPSIEEYTDDSAAAYTSITELIMDKDGKEYMLHTNGAIRNVRIATGTWSEDGRSFTQDAVIFSASTICLDNAIMIQTNSLDDLCLTYESAEELITANLFNLVK